MHADRNDLFDPGSSFVRDLSLHMRKKGVPAFALAILDGEHTQTLTLGASQTDLFQCSVLSHWVTSVLILRLAQERKLDLHRDLSDLSSFRPLCSGKKAAPLTLAQLLSHSAGILPTYLPAYPRRAALPGVQDILWGHSPARNRPLTRQLHPDLKGSYSAGGTVLAQAAVEELLQSDFASLMQEYLFSPLGMEHSCFCVEPPVSPLPGHGHFRRRITGNYLLQPQGCLWTCAQDMEKLLSVFSPSGTYLTKASCHFLSAPYHRSVFSLGLVCGTQGLAPCAMLGGGSHGYQSKLLFFPEDSRAILMLANANSAFPVFLRTQYALYQALSWPYLPQEPSVQRRSTTHADQV